MTTVDMPGFVVPIEARIDRLEKSFKKANQAQNKAAREMERRAKQSADRMAQSYEDAGGKISGAFKNMVMPKMAGLVGTVAGIGVAGAATAVRQTVQGIAEIGDSAKRAGMHVGAFQEWAYVADQNRVSVDALVDGFKELSLRADEFIFTGAGSAAEAFKRLGIGAEELKVKLADPSALMVDLVKRMEGLDKAAQIRIADELFGGTGGEQFVQLLDKGAAGIQGQIRRANELGIVLDEGAVRKAAELDAKFREVETRLQSMWRTGVVGAAEFFGLVEREKIKLTFDPATTSRLFGPDTAEALGAMPEIPQDALAQVEGLKLEYQALADEARMLVPALSEASSMMRGLGNEAGASALTDLASRIGDAARAFEEGDISGAEYADRLREVVTEAEASLAAMDDLDKARLAGVIGQVSSLLDWINQLPGAAAAARDEIASLSMMDTGVPLTGTGAELLPRSPLAPESSPKPKQRPFELGVPDPKPARGGGGGGGRGSQDEYARALDNLQREKAGLDAQAVALVAAAQSGMVYADAIEYARTRADLLNSATQAGKQITPELTSEIDRLAQAHVQAGNAAQKAADDLERIEDRGKKGAEALSDVFGAVLDGSMSAEEALGQLLLQMAKVQMQRALMGLFSGTGVGEFVGGLLGFSEGGFTGLGQKHQPAGIVHANEYVFSSEAVKRIGAGNLDAMHRAAKSGAMGYASGGLVGEGGKIAKATSARSMDSAQASAPVVTINSPITVNGSAGTPEQNSDLAKQIARETEAGMRALIQTELSRQMRPGGMLRR